MSLDLLEVELRKSFSVLHDVGWDCKRRNKMRVWARRWFQKIFIQIKATTVWSRGKRVEFMRKVMFGIV